MEPSRVERYLDKLDHAQERIGLAESWVKRADEEIHWRLATYKAFQEGAEALSDLVAMVAVDSGRNAKDDYTNIDLAVEEGALEPGTAAALVEATGLRNRLVHEYDTLEDDLALTSMEDLIGPIQESLQEVEAWLTSKR